MATENLGIDSLTIGVSRSGMDAYREELKMEVIQTTKELIDDYADVETAINNCWQGVSRDRFLDKFKNTREQIKNDLDAEYNDLNARLEELEYMYYQQDSNMIME